MQITNVVSIPALCGTLLCVCILLYLPSICCAFLAFRWEEERYTDGSKWRFLEHKGPVFAPPYEPLPSNVKFYYDGMYLGPCLYVRWEGSNCSIRTLRFILIGLASKLLEKQMLGG